MRSYFPRWGTVTCRFPGLGMHGQSNTALQQFLDRYCPDPNKLAEILGAIARVKQLTDGEVLCRIDERAECYWLIEEGVLQVRFGNGKLLDRGRGELVGEAAFYRPLTTEKPYPFRGADIVSSGISSVRVIDHAKIAEMDPTRRSLWHETMARVLTAKLDQATTERAAMIRGNKVLQTTLRRFVCEPGIEAAQYHLQSDGAGHISPEKITAVIWFSDVVGFSPYAKEDSAGAASHLRRIMDLQVQEIGQRGGHIDKFIGDGLMAFWECPDADRCARHAAGAVQAALATVEAVVGYVRENSLPLDIRVGLHTGEVLMGDFGGRDRIGFTLIGHAVNEAARYEQAREAVGGTLGRVRVSQPLFAAIASRELQDRFLAQPVTVKVKHGLELPTFTIADE